MKQGRSKGLIALIVVLAFILTSQVALAGPTIHVLGDAVGSGKAEMKTAFDKWLSVTGKAYPVVDGTTFRTLEGAVSVMLRDGVRMEMGKQTTLIVNGAQGNYTVAVNSGTLGFTVPVGTAFSVITPTATVLVQQGEGAVGKAGLTPGETVRGVVVCDAKGTKVMSLNGTFLVRNGNGVGTQLLASGSAVYVNCTDSGLSIKQAQLADDAAQKDKDRDDDKINGLIVLGGSVLIEGGGFLAINSSYKSYQRPASPSKPGCRISPCL